MKPRTFAVGDRVAFKGLAWSFNELKANYCDDPCVVKALEGKWRTPNLILESVLSKREYEVHPRQLVRLIKKAKPEPREWEGQWVETYIGGDLRAVYLPYQPKNAPAQQMRLREVLKPGGRREKS